MPAHTYIAGFIFAFAVVALIVSALLSAFAASEVEKKNFAKASQFAVGSSVFTGVGIIGIVIAVAIYMFGVYPEEVKKAKETAKEVMGGVTGKVKDFTDKYIARSACDVSVPLKDLLNLKADIEPPAACPAK